MSPEQKGPQEYGPVQETDLKEHVLPPSRIFRHRAFDFYVDENRLVAADGMVSNLGWFDQDALVLLCANPNRAISREKMLRSILNIDDSIPLPKARTIDVHIACLRRKLGDKHNKNPIIETVGLFGYKLNDPDRQPNYQVVELAPQEPKAEEIYRLQGFDFYIDEMYIQRGQARVALGKTEARLLAYLAKNRNRVVKYVDVYDNVWCDKVLQNAPSALRANISLLRSKLSQLGLDGKAIIHRRRATGYMLVDESALSVE